MSAYVRQPAVGRADRLLTLSVVFILLGLYTATFIGIDPGGEAELRFQTTSAVARTGRAVLGGTPEAKRVVMEARLAETVGRSTAGTVVSRSGEVYAGHGIGSALLSAPLYGLGQVGAVMLPAFEERHTEIEEGARSEYFAHVAVGWRNALLGALLGGLLFETARRMGVRRAPAWGGALAFGVATYAWPSALSSQVEVLATFLLFLAFHWIVMMRETFERLTAPRAWTLFALGLVLGLAVLTRPSAALAVVVLALGAFSVLRSGRAQFLGTGTERMRRRGEKLRWLSTFMALPLLAAVLVLLAFDRERYGDPFATMRTLLVDQPLRPQLIDELLAPGNGLLWLAPGVILCPLGLKAAWSDGERLWPWVLIGVGACSALPLVESDVPLVEPSYGPRHLLLALPFAWVGVLIALDQTLARPGLRVAAAGLFLAGVLAAVPAVLVDARTYGDLALQAAEIERGPAAPLDEARNEAGDADPPGATGPEADEPQSNGAGAEAGSPVELSDLGWDWRYAVPWAYWRILRHRVAGGGEAFDARELFAVASERPLVPSDDRDQGFRHLAFVDLSLRLDGPGGMLLLSSFGLVLVGLALASRGFQPGRS